MRRKTRCPVCGSSKIAVHYRRVLFNAADGWPGEGDFHDFEYLEKECICGYKWQEPTKEATDADNAT